MCVTLSRFLWLPTLVPVLSDSQNPVSLVHSLIPWGLAHCRNLMVICSLKAQRRKFIAWGNVLTVEILVSRQKLSLSWNTQAWTPEWDEKAWGKVSDSVGSVVVFRNPCSHCSHPESFRDNRRIRASLRIRLLKSLKKKIRVIFGKDLGCPLDQLDYFSSFSWIIVALQCCISFCFTTMWMSCKCTWIPSPWATPPSHPSGSSQSTELSSLCYIAASCWLYLTHGSVSIPVLLSQLLPHSPSLPVSTSRFSMSVSLFLPCKYGI